VPSIAAAAARARCTGAPEATIANGNWSATCFNSGTLHGANCTGTCRSGYIGRPVATCVDGTYDILSTTCRECPWACMM
jgi:hypothetical protein